MKTMQYKDFCDIIIENLTKEWYSSMAENVQTNNPNWETPKYSKKQIDKAGKIIANVITNSSDVPIKELEQELSGENNKDKNTIKLVLENKQLIISSNSPEIGKVEEKIAIDNVSSISISFSSKYMLEAIKSFNSEKIHLLMNNDNSPIIVKSDNEESLTQLVLPIKTY